MSEAILINPDLWATSRAGARAGRGFRFQDAAGAWLATRIWAGEIGATALVPEGVDDITLHGGPVEVRIQVKARHDPRGRFTTAELAAILAKSAGSVDIAALRSCSCRLVLLLERPAQDIAETGWDGSLADEAINVALLEPHLRDFVASRGIAVHELLAAATLISIADPLDASVALICARRGSPDAVARLVAHRLRHLVGEYADQNYRAPADRPAIVSAADVEALADAVLALVDPAALFPAIAEGLCELVSFVPVETPFFYEGVDVAPGHVASGLVLERPDLVEDIAAGLQRQRCTLIAGPSGSGKSAAAWLFAYQNRHAIRWYRLRRAAPDQAHLLVQLARSLEASPERPVGFVLDDIGRDLSGIWEALASELRHESGVLLLGTIREEDLFLIGNLASTAVARPTLDAELAERIWSALREDRELAFLHWREPFELSEGLLLEFGHLLTSGQRLRETLDAQVRRRLVEARDDELAILQAVVPAARFGGAIEAERLRDRLGLSSAAYARALARLVDEHALRVGTDGSLGGLHQIRSAGLYEALGEHFPRQIETELSEMAEILRAQDFALVLPQLVRARPEADDALLDALAERAASFPISELAAVFHGLGLATCDRVAAGWSAIVEEEGLDPRHAGTAFSFGLIGSRFDIPQFAKLDAVSGRISEVQQRDLRTELLFRMGGLPDEVEVVLDDYHELAASLVPMPVMSPAPPFTALPAGDWMEVPLAQGLAVAATVREFGVELAERLLDRFGGTDHLLGRIHQEIAWITRPRIVNENDALVISSDVRFMGEPIHPNANDVVVAHCERLLAAAPRAVIADSSMLGWDGEPAGFKDHALAVKHIPRDNLPSPVRIAWNRAALRAIQSRNGPTTESGRANALANAIIELAEMLADAAELYCRGLRAEQRFEMLLSVRALLNSFIQPPSVGSGARSARDQGDYEIADRAFDFVTSVTKLAQDLAGGIERPILASIEAAKLRAAVEALLSADGWRWIDAPPADALRALSEILHDLDAVLGDAHAHPEAFRRSQLNAERTSRRHRARIRFGIDARERARQTAREMTAQISAALAAHDIEAIVVSRPMEDLSAPYWPRVDYAVLLSVGHLVDYMVLADNFTEVVRQFPDTHRVAIAPVREGSIVAGLAGVIYDSFLPMADFTEKWTGHVPLPFLNERAAAALAEALNVLLQVSAVFANSDRDLNDEELAYAQQMIDSVKGRLALLETLRDTEDDEDIGAACILVDEVLDRIRRELDGDPSERMSAEFARMGNGEQTDFTTRIIGHRIGLLERDILAAASSNVRADAAS
jgi:energy-coupling factor transporter ATP-binding protein EcfA2